MQLHVRSQFSVIPVQTGIQKGRDESRPYITWTPAFAGVTTLLFDPTKFFRRLPEVLP
jgi:hypothetical protein